MNNLNILVVEDNPDHQLLLERALTENRPHVNIQVAKSGNDFFSKLDDYEYDCIIMDHNLPDSTADELLKKIHQENRKMPVITISSETDQDVVISNMRSGSLDFVPKSDALRPNYLWERVEHTISMAKNNNKSKFKTERRRKELVRLTEIDPLTGLYNRRYFERQLRRKNYSRDRRLTTSLIFADIDHFKFINDTYGHNAGDEALRKVGQIIRNSLEPGEAALRWGGEEFLIIKTSCKIRDCWTWADEIKEKIERKQLQYKDIKFSVTVSIGIGEFKTSSINYDAVDEVDAAMFLAKNLGRNKICTTDMKKIEDVLSEIENLTGSTIDKRNRFIEKCSEFLGPTQMEHLTVHCEQVSQFSVKVAEKMGIKGDHLKQIEIAGLLHDLGKCIVPEEILCQIEKLTLSQFRIINGHSNYGAEIALRLGCSNLVAEAIRYHHMPNRFYIRKASSHIEAKILSVADAYSTMLSGRVYRAARPTSMVLQELRNKSGFQFSPEIVQAAIKASNSLKHS